MEFDEDEIWLRQKGVPSEEKHQIVLLKFSRKVRTHTCNDVSFRVCSISSSLQSHYQIDILFSYAFLVCVHHDSDVLFVLWHLLLALRGWKGDSFSILVVQNRSYGTVFVA